MLSVGTDGWERAQEVDLHRWLLAVMEAGRVDQLPGNVWVPTSLHGVLCENRAIMRAYQLNLSQYRFDNLSPPRLALRWVPLGDVEHGLWSPTDFGSSPSLAFYLLGNILRMLVPHL